MISCKSSVGGTHWILPIQALDMACSCIVGEMDQGHVLNVFVYCWESHASSYYYCVAAVICVLNTGVLTNVMMLCSTVSTCCGHVVELNVPDTK